MISCHVEGMASVVRVHCDQGAVNGEYPVILVTMVSEFLTPLNMRDDLGFITYTHMTVTGYSEN